MEKEYLDWVGFFSLPVIAASSAFFLNVNRPVTWLTLLTVTVAFGFSAYVSRDGFKLASVASLMTLFLAISTPEVAAVAVIVGFGCPLVSLFSGRGGFKSYFSSVAIPLLVVGLILGGGLWAKSQYDAETRNLIKNSFSDLTEEQAKIILKQTETDERYSQLQKKIAKQVSRASISRTANIVQENLSDPSPETAREIRNSFLYAEQNVPGEIYRAANLSAPRNTADVAESVSRAVEEQISGKLFIAIIPVLGLALYSVSPFVGLLTGLFGVLFERILDGY